MTTPGFLTVEEAARTLDVTARHVQRLAESTEITKVARGLVDQSSVERYLAAQRQGRTRSWAEHTAWGAVAELAGRAPRWLGDAQASRLRRALREMADADELVTRLRERARTLTFDAHRAALPRLRRAVVTSDLTQLGLTAADPDELDGYLPADALEGVLSSLGLRASAGGQVVLRVTAFDAGVVADLVRTPVVAALDAATSTDPRVRGGRPPGPDRRPAVVPMSPERPRWSRRCAATRWSGWAARRRSVAPSTPTWRSSPG